MAAPCFCVAAVCDEVRNFSKNDWIYGGQVDIMKKVEKIRKRE